MSTALVRLTAGRPAVVDQGGVRCYIAVHDEGFRTTKAAYKQQLRRAHPDFAPVRYVEVPAHTRAAHGVAPRGGTDRRGRRLSGRAYTRRATAVPDYQLPIPNSGKAFRQVQRAYAAWLTREAAWYAQYGLAPPVWGGD